MSLDLEDAHSWSAFFRSYVTYRYMTVDLSPGCLGTFSYISPLFPFSLDSLLLCLLRLPSSTRMLWWGARTRGRLCCGTTGAIRGPRCRGLHCLQQHIRYSKHLSQWACNVFYFTRRWIKQPLLCLQHPVYCVNVVGTQNANNLISISTDGKMCSWSLDMLSQPQVTHTVNVFGIRVQWNISKLPKLFRNKGFGIKC